MAQEVNLNSTARDASNKPHAFVAESAARLASPQPSRFGSEIINRQRFVLIGYFDEASRAGTPLAPGARRIGIRPIGRIYLLTIEPLTIARCARQASRDPAKASEVHRYTRDDDRGG